MSTMSVRLPNSLHRQLRELAEREGVSMNQLISSAVGEKLAALLTADYLKERAQRGSRRRYDGVLRKVQDTPPVAGDELPNKRMQQTRSARSPKRKRRPRS
jgi:predicted DNA-binding ribbon-helix-helix protein